MQTTIAFGVWITLQAACLVSAVRGSPPNAVLFGRLPRGRRILVRLLDLTLLTTIVATVAVVPSGAATVTTIAFLFALFCLYQISWGFYLSTGDFLDAAGLVFLWRNVGQLVAHELQLTGLVRLAIGMALVGALAASLTASAILAPALPTWFAIADVVAIVLLLLAESLRAKPSDDDVALYLGSAPRGRFRRYCAIYQSGPLIRLIAWKAGAFVPSSTTADDPATTPGSHPQRGVPDGGERRHVILVVVESLRQYDLWREPLLDRLPFLGSLQHDGLVFRNHFTTATHSNYADVSILNGRYPLLGARQHDYRPDDIRGPALHEVLQGAGYRCGLFSAQNEHWGGMHHATALSRFDACVHAGLGARDRAIARSKFQAYDPARSIRNAGKLDDEVVVDCAREWFTRLAPDGPCLLVLNLQGSHFPYLSPDDVPLADSTIRFGRYDERFVPKMWERYLASLWQIDRLLDSLHRSCVDACRGDVSMVVTGDTGQAFMERGRAGHGADLFDEVIRVPLLITGSDRLARIDTACTSHVDLAPTILELCGVSEVPEEWDGSSLLRPLAARAIFVVGQTPLVSQAAAIVPGGKLLQDFRTGCRNLIAFDDNALFASRSGDSDAMASQLATVLDRFVGTRLAARTRGGQRR